MPGTGELAAFTVSVLWTFGTLLFAWCARRIGPDATNLLRISVAVLALASLRTLLLGAPWPREASALQLGLLALSALFGLVIGDGSYFRSLTEIGARRSSLLMALAPALTAILGWLVLGERLGARAVAGMLLTLAGCAWVIAERTGAAAPGERARRPVAGALYGLLGALGQASGLVVAKSAMHGLDALSTAGIRMTAAATMVWIIAALRGRGRSDGARMRLPGVAPRIVAAALLGPTFGVWLSLYAVAHTQAAVAATLMALVPVLILPVARLVDREPISTRAVAGALVAVAGVVVLVTRA